MTCYRQGSIGSYTKRLDSDRDFFIEVRTQLAEMWRLFGEEHQEYVDVSRQAEMKYRCELLKAELQDKSFPEVWRLVHGDRKLEYKWLSHQSRAKLWIRALFPRLVAFGKSIRSMV